MNIILAPSPTRTPQQNDPDQELDEDANVLNDDAVVPDDVDEDIGFELVREELVVYSRPRQIAQICTFNWLRCQLER